MFTTISIKRSSKEKLDSFGSKGDSYADIIDRIIDRLENQLEEK